MTTNRLELLRNLMRDKGVDAVIVPGTDPHQSEYVSPHWKFREWLTGFTGSYGTAVVTLHDAGLWTDSRYFLQAEKELEGSGFTMYKNGWPGEPTINEWLAAHLSEDDTLAVDGRLFTLAQANRIETFCGENGFLFAPDFFPADLVWKDRPERPTGKVTLHEVEYAGEEVESKIERVMADVEAQDADSTLLVRLDDIAWLFNLRGEDVEFTPVAVAFAYLSTHDRVLFIDDNKLTKEASAALKALKVRVREYDDIERFLTKRSLDNTILLDPNSVSDALGQALMCGKVYGPSPVAPLKAIKNTAQVEGFRRAMERDGAALVRLFMWIEENAASGTVNELDVWERGKAERAKSELYRGDSFEMIAGYKEHGAIVHYAATPQTAATLHADGLLLVDSGAQYLDATTDITRTITLGNPTDEERHDYTLVLKGHLALQRAQFPEGTRGDQLDALARIFMWQEGLQYLHGTGHGVGQFLCCHEGPQSIRMNHNPTQLEAGMVVSNEPGIYRAGKHGVRIENLLLCTEASQSEEWGNFLKWETLTLFPYDAKLIDKTMLTAEEIAQVNDYHAQVLERLTPMLNDEERQWLEGKTQPL